MSAQGVVAVDRLSHFGDDNVTLAVVSIGEAFHVEIFFHCSDMLS